MKKEFETENFKSSQYLRISENGAGILIYFRSQVSVFLI